MNKKIINIISTIIENEDLLEEEIFKTSGAFLYKCKDFNILPNFDTLFKVKHPTVWNFLQDNYELTKEQEKNLIYENFINNEDLLKKKIKYYVFLGQGDKFDVRFMVDQFDYFNEMIIRIKPAIEENFKNYSMDDLNHVPRGMFMRGFYKFVNLSMDFIEKYKVPYKEFLIKNKILHPEAYVFLDMDKSDEYVLHDIIENGFISSYKNLKAYRLDRVIDKFEYFRKYNSKELHIFSNEEILSNKHMLQDILLEKIRDKKVNLINLINKKLDDDVLLEFFDYDFLKKAIQVNDGFNQEISYSSLYFSTISEKTREKMIEKYSKIVEELVQKSESNNIGYSRFMSLNTIDFLYRKNSNKLLNDLNLSNYLYEEEDYSVKDFNKDLIKKGEANPNVMYLESLLNKQNFYYVTKNSNNFIEEDKIDLFSEIIDNTLKIQDEQKKDNYLKVYKLILNFLLKNNSSFTKKEDYCNALKNLINYLDKKIKNNDGVIDCKRDDKNFLTLINTDNTIFISNKLISYQLSVYPEIIGFWKNSLDFKNKDILNYLICIKEEVLESDAIESKDKIDFFKYMIKKNPSLKNLFLNDLIQPEIFKLNEFKRDEVTLSKLKKASKHKNVCEKVLTFINAKNLKIDYRDLEIFAESEGLSLKDIKSLILKNYDKDDILIGYLEGFSMNEKLKMNKVLEENSFLCANLEDRFASKISTQFLDMKTDELLASRKYKELYELFVLPLRNKRFSKIQDHIGELSDNDFKTLINDEYLFKLIAYVANYISDFNVEIKDKNLSISFIEMFRKYQKNNLDFLRVLKNNTAICDYVENHFYESIISFEKDIYTCNLKLNFKNKNIENIYNNYCNNVKVKNANNLLKFLTENLLQDCDFFDEEKKVKLFSEKINYFKEKNSILYVALHLNFESSIKKFMSDHSYSFKYMEPINYLHLMNVIKNAKEEENFMVGWVAKVILESKYGNDFSIKEKEDILDELIKRDLLMSLNSFNSQEWLMDSIMKKFKYDYFYKLENLFLESDDKCLILYNQRNNRYCGNNVLDDMSISSTQMTNESKYEFLYKVYKDVVVSEKNSAKINSIIQDLEVWSFVKDLQINEKIAMLTKKQKNNSSLYNHLIDMEEVDVLIKIKFFCEMEECILKKSGGERLKKI